MTTAVVPLSNLTRRAPEAGRIRLGVKTARAMKAIDKFRFTSPYEDCIRQLAEMYGGTPEPWDDDRARIRNQWQVITEATEINIFVNAAGLSQQYELWSGGGRTRSCDGVTCEVPGRDGDMEQVPCICISKNLAECNLHTRLTVFLPELPFRGSWRLETKGWNAGHEMPGMVDLIDQLEQGGAMVTAKLTLEPRSQVKNGKKQNWVTPVVSVAQSPQQILAGQAAVGSIAAGGAPAEVESGTPALPSNTDDEIVEAEIVSDEELEIRDLLQSDAVQFGFDPDRFIAAVMRQAKNDLDKARSAHDKMVAGELEPIAFKASGLLDWKKLEP